MAEKETPKERREEAAATTARKDVWDRAQESGRLMREAVKADARRDEERQTSMPRRGLRA